MLIWGLAPALIERVFHSEPPPVWVLARGGLSMFLGAVFLFLWRSVRRRARWAIWLVHVLALLIATGSTVLAIFNVTDLSVFPLVLAGWCVGSTWFALRWKPPARTPLTPRPVSEYAGRFGGQGS